MDFADLTPAYFEAAIIRPAKGNRLFAFGRFADGTIAVVFGVLGVEAISVISMRRASTTERKLYEQAKRI